MKNILAVFWDVDGTIVDSESLHIAKINGIAANHGIILTNAHWKFLQGVGDHRVYEYLSGRGMRLSEKEFMNSCLDYYQQNIGTIKVREGFHEAFDYLSLRGIFQSVVSNGVSQQVKSNLSLTGVGDKFLDVIDADVIVKMGLRTKPSPDSYLEALRLLNERSFIKTPILPAQCAVVEDSPPGVEAGKCAGMTTVFWRMSRDHVSPHADIIVDGGKSLLSAVRNLVTPLSLT